MQARQFQIDIAGFRDRNSGRFPTNIDELITFMKTTDGFAFTDSQFVFNDRHRGLSEIWIYKPPSLLSGQIDIIFRSPEKVNDRFIIGLSNGELKEVGEIPSVF